MTEHHLKTLPPYYEDVLLGKKPFEVRKNDRNFKVDDKLYLNEYENGKYTGRSLSAYITYVLDNNEYCKDGYAVLGINNIFPIL